MKIIGRYLAYGINTEIEIRKKHTWYSSDELSIKKNKKQILNQLDNFFDMSMYECTNEEEERLEFCLKNESFSSNIYDFLEEIEKDFSLKNFFHNYIIEKGKTYFKNREPMILENGYIKLSNDELGNYFYSKCLEYIVFDEELSDNFEILTNNAIIWCDSHKIDSEDDFYLCNIINKVSREHYKSKLSKNAIFLIFG